MSRTLKSGWRGILFVVCYARASVLHNDVSFVRDYHEHEQKPSNIGVKKAIERAQRIAFRTALDKLKKILAWRPARLPLLFNFQRFCSVRGASH